MKLRRGLGRRAGETAAVEFPEQVEGRCLQRGSHALRTGLVAASTAETGEQRLAPRGLGHVHGKWRVASRTHRLAIVGEDCGRDFLLADAGAFPLRLQLRATTAIKVVEAEGVLAGLERHFAFAQLRRMDAIIVHHALLVDEQPRAVIRIGVEGVFAVLGNGDDAPEA